MLPPLTSTDPTTVSDDGSHKDNNIDQKEDRKLPATQPSFHIHMDGIETKAKPKAKGQLLVKNAPAITDPRTADVIDLKEDRKLPATQTSFKIQKSCKDDATKAKAGDTGLLLAKNAPGKTNSKPASKCTRYAGDKEGSKYVPKKVPGESSLDDSALRYSGDKEGSKYAPPKKPKEALQHKNDGASRPGAFAMSGIGGGSGNNIWESTNHCTTEEDGFMVDDESEYFVEALDEEDLQDSICRNILKEAVEAAEVVVVNDDEERAKETKCVVNWICVLLTVLGTVIGLSIGLTKTNESEMTSTSEYPSASPTIIPTRTMIPTLDTIQNNGKVRCGVRLIVDAEIDLCRVLAAAVLGDAGKIDVKKHSFTSRWEALANGSIDVLTLPSTHIMDRDIYQKDTKAGYTFSTPFYYDGLVFGGIPEYVDCADRLDTYFGNCSEVRICVHMGSSHHDALVDNLADFNLRPVKTNNFIEMFIQGKCNVLAASPFSISESILQKDGYAGEYKLGHTILMKEPLGMVTREDDKKWSDFVNWVFLSLKAAEEQNITNATASKFMTTTVFGDKYKDMFVNAIQAVGNYGDLYKRNLEDIVPRDAFQINLLNNGSTGLHFAYPIGIPNEMPDPIAGSTMHSITKEQGKLRCGIFDRVGFGKEIVSTKGTRWEGMDADYCYALSASLFKGQTNKVAFVNLTNSVDGFQALESGLVDVVAGVPLTIEGDVNETSTGRGYTFSLPYFYGGINGPDNTSETPEGALSLVTREDDSQWSDFVFWTVSATFIAEEEYITQKMSDEMDGISVFGPSFVEMYRHAIGAVGNYGEIYSRHVESIEPRQGRNLLNTNPFGPQLVSFF